MGIKTCLCCGHPLLRHVRRQGVYWFCTVCHQEMIPLKSSQSSIRVDTLQLMPNSQILRSRPLETVQS